MAESIDTSDFTPQREWTGKGKRPKVSKAEVDAMWEGRPGTEEEQELLDLYYGRKPAISDRQKKLLAEMQKMEREGKIIDLQHDVF